MEANTTTTQQLLQGGAKCWVNGLGRLDGQQQNQNPQFLMEGREDESQRWRGVCVSVCLCSYSIQLVAALAKLHPLSCCQFRLQAVVLIQQVCDQNINQVRAARGREDLNLCLIENSVFKENRR